MDRESLWKAAIDEAPNGLLLVDQDRTILDCNGTFARFVKKAPGQLTGENLLSVVEVSGKEGLLALLRSEAYGRESYIGEFMDEGREYRLSQRLVDSGDGRPPFYFLLMENMDYREQEEGRVRISHKKLEHLLDNTNEGILFCDTDGKPVYYNAPYARKMKELLGIEMQPGLQPHKLLPDPAAVAFWDDLHREVLSGKSFTREFTFPSGEQTLFFEHVFHPVLEGDRIVGFTEFTRDITERVRMEKDKHALEEVALQSQKMEAIGTLAGGIAHDFNNLLTGILGHSNLLQMKTDPGDERYNSVLTIARAAERGANLTAQLLGFARKGKQQTITLQMDEIIGEVVELLGHSLDRNIRISTKLNAGERVVHGDPTQLHQVILNLALNSRDAMPAGGDLVISSGGFHADEEYTRTHPESRQGDYLCISVRDTGCGISPEIRDRIFDPFFTTKSADSGSGMGLAMVYGIVRNHDGFIRVDSIPERGTDIRIYLPVVSGQESGEIPDDQLEAQRGTGHILLIDDEQSILDITGKLLEKLGYTVTVFQQAEAAVDWYVENYRDVDLVIMDMIMPGIDGRQCFNLLKKINHRLKVILSTGYDLDGRGQKILNSGLAGLIRKPYSIIELGQAIKSLLR